MPQGTAILHASAVALEGRAVLLMGASGSGKSSLSLSLMAFGASLVGDDRVQIEAVDDALYVRPAPNLAGLIEARGIGILRAAYSGRAEVALAVDLDQTETRRLPDARMTHLLGIGVPCIHKGAFPTFPAAILQYLKAGRAEA